MGKKKQEQEQVKRQERRKFGIESEMAEREPS